jgi:hypothetical protein
MNAISQIFNQMNYENTIIASNLAINTLSKLIIVGEKKSYIIFFHKKKLSFFKNSYLA